MPKVTFKTTGDEAEAAEGQELREVTKKAGWPVAYACEDGQCGTCLIKTAPGETNLSPMEEKEKNTLNAMGMNDGSHRLACQCKVQGNVNIEV